MENRLRFRAWIKDAPMLREEAEGGMFYQEDQYLSSFIRRIYDQYKVNHPSQLSFELEDRLTQCTWKRDKTGTLIYSGDILIFRNSCPEAKETADNEGNLATSSVYECYFNQEDAMFKYKYNTHEIGSGRIVCRNETYSMLICKGFGHSVEIIGNKFCNPELLEVKDEDSKN